ncbi:hypothetical protein KORDIASMS9_03506 [Kordia sp. SMS9]|uniref:hypothetical protein n=1 Tax=Kordia sp. SMS9 TaxID=2282170 RepID=UPI000E0D4788|nr:hypothetical protein [Kordia sp. SMS9]AXG71249.1 hypothetical protein KORDIASMS9_03506 [Kordia sp. SMS9]
MAKETFCEAEERRLKKIVNFGLPNHYKKIGIAIAVLSFLTLIILKITGVEISETLKFISKRVVLLGLLIVVLSREKVEDEMMLAIRGKALAGAFVGGAVYTLIYPAITYAAAVVMGNKTPKLVDTGDFQILWFMLFMYLLFFYLIKKNLK